MSSARPTVLIVEDDRSTREYLSSALRLGGFDARSVGDGLAALREVEQHRPDALLLDLDLPLMNGFAVHSMLQQDEHTRTIPIVILTGTGLAGPTPTAARFDKPVSADILIRVLYDALARVPAADADVRRTVLWLCPNCGNVVRETSEPGHPLTSEMRRGTKLCQQCVAS